MSRLLALTLVAVTFAGVGAGSADALSNPQSTLLRNLSNAELKALIQDIDAQGLNASNSTNVKTGIGRMQMASGRIAALGFMGSIPLIAAGSTTVWQIADALGLGGYVYRKITGESYAQPQPSFSVVWNYFPSNGSSYNYNYNATTPWVLGTYCNPVSPATGELAKYYVVAHNISGTAFLTDGPSNGTCTAANATYVKIRTQAEMEAAIGIEPAVAADYTTPGAGVFTRTGGTNDTTTPTDLELEAALDAIDPVPGTAGTAVEQDTGEAILDELSPGWDATFITLPKPQPNETYTAYVARLQALGYVGTATSTVLTSELEGYGPEAVARLTYTTTTNGTTTTRTLDPLRWPTTSPLIGTDVALTIRYNSSTAPPAPTEGTGTGGSLIVPPTTIPPTVGIDFTPITDLAVGCKFPWGFVCYAVDVTGWFDVPADAPRFAFDVPDVTVAGNTYGGVGSYAVDLNVMDSYMALLRDLISIALWVGAVWVLATRLLGLNVGDPGEAADEGLHV